MSFNTAANAIVGGLGKPLTQYKGAKANAWLQAGHSEAITCMTQDDDNIYTGSEDYTAIAWSKATGKIKLIADSIGNRHPVTPFTIFLLRTELSES